MAARLVALLLAALAVCAAEEASGARQKRQKPALSTRLVTYSIKDAAKRLGRSDWSEVTQGNKIVLPQSILAQLEQRSLPYTQFQICNPECKEKRMYTGPLDFCAADGECYLPTWVMRQLKLNEGDVVAVATAQFPSGVFARFQPHSSDFLDVANHYYLLLKTLDNFAVRRRPRAPLPRSRTLSRARAPLSRARAPSRPSPARVHPAIQAVDSRPRCSRRAATEFAPEPTPPRPLSPAAAGLARRRRLPPAPLSA